MRRDGAYQEECAAQEAWDNEMYRRDWVRREAEDHARGVRSGDFLAEYAPVTPVLDAAAAAKAALDRKLAEAKEAA